MPKESSGAKQGAQQGNKQRKPLPPLAWWGIGYLPVPCLAVGLVYFWRVAFSLPGALALPLTVGSLLAFTLLYVALFCICRFARGRLPLQAALAVLVVGLFFCFATAPMQVPDEHSHFLRAYALSEGRFNYDRARGYPEDVSLLLQHFPAGHNHDVQFGGAQLLTLSFDEYWADVAAGTQPAIAANEPIMLLMLPFLPQAVFIFAARLLGFTALGQMYAARMANLLIYTLICYFAFKNCAKYRGLFFAAALLPISLSLGASCSYDALVLSLSFLAISYFCKEEIHSRDVVVFGLAVAFMTYLKLPNIVLVAVLLLIPKARWKTRWNPRLLFVILLGGALAVYWLAGRINSPLGPLAQNYENLPRPGTANPTAQLGFMLQNPLRFAAVALLTLVRNAFYLFDLGVVGWLDVDIPLVSGLSVLALAAASALGIQQKDDTRPGGAVGLFLAAALYGGAVVAGMYMAETDVGAIFVGGIQPRYLIPAFLMLFMLCSILLGKAVRPRLSASEETARTETVTLCIAAAVAVVAAVLILQSFFIGQWFNKAEGGQKMVNLLGWVVR